MLSGLLPGADGEGGQVGHPEALQPRQVDDEGGAPHHRAEQPGGAGQQGQQEPPQPQGAGELLGGHGVTGDAGDGHHDEHGGRDDLGLHRRRAHHQAADDGHGLADGLGQAQAGLLQDLEGQQQHDDLKAGAEGHVLLGGDDGQGQPGGDHLLVEGDHGHVEGGEQQGEQHAPVAQQGEHRGQHPALRPVLGGPEEVPQHPGGQVAQGEAVDEHPHPPLRQPGAEAVGPLGVLEQGEGGALGGDDILLDVAGGQDGVNVDVRQPPGHPVHQGGVGEPLYI